MDSSQKQYRNEYKFICSEEKMLLIEDSIRLLCFPDSHAGENGRYLIRSMYFDTPGNAFYLQTKNGLGNRYKYRIRIYNDSDKFIALERKESLWGKKHKRIHEISRSTYDGILRGISPSGDAESGSEDSLLDLFLTEKSATDLEPKVIIEYERTPYVYPIGNVRITFDRRLKSARPVDLFDGFSPGMDVLKNGAGILEVKYDDVLPGAISDALHSFDLYPETFSKYSFAREALAGQIGDLL